MGAVLGVPKVIMFVCASFLPSFSSRTCASHGSGNQITAGRWLRAAQGARESQKDLVLPERAEAATMPAATMAAEAAARAADAAAAAERASERAACRAP